MLCSECAVSRGLSGQGFTYYECEKCGQKGYWYNTCVPKICPQCSKDYYLCEQCGKDLIVDKVEKMRSSRDWSLYEVALELECSESTLRKLINKDEVSDSVKNKIVKKMKEIGVW